MNIQDFNVHITWGLTKNFLVPSINMEGQEVLIENLHDCWKIFGSVTYVPKIEPRPDDILRYQFESDVIHLCQFTGKFLQAFSKRVELESKLNLDKAKPQYRVPTTIKVNLTQ